MKLADMTTTELDELQALCDATTYGEIKVVWAEFTPNGSISLEIASEAGFQHKLALVHLVKFISNSFTAMPRLIAELRRFRIVLRDDAGEGEWDLINAKAEIDCLLAERAALTGRVEKAEAINAVLKEINDLKEELLQDSSAITGGLIYPKLVAALARLNELEGSVA